MDKMGEGEREVQGSSYRMNKSQGSKVQHWESSQWYRNSIILYQMGATLMASMVVHQSCCITYYIVCEVDLCLSKYIKV